jgi:hypothetical protein
VKSSHLAPIFFGGVTRIPGTTSFLMSGRVATGSSATEKPTIFRFDL